MELPGYIYEHTGNIYSEVENYSEKILFTMLLVMFLGLGPTILHYD